VKEFFGPVRLRFLSVGSFRRESGRGGRALKPGSHGPPAALT